MGRTKCECDHSTEAHKPSGGCQGSKPRRTIEKNYAEQPYENDCECNLTRDVVAALPRRAKKPPKPQSKRCPQCGMGWVRA